VETFASQKLVFDRREGFMKREENKGGKDIMPLSKGVYRTKQAVQTFSSEEKRRFIKSLLYRFSGKNGNAGSGGGGLCSPRTRMIEG